MRISARVSHLGACCALALLGCCPPVLAATNRIRLASEGERKDALSGFQLEDGFRLEVAAAEPMVSGPVAIAFDENNRLYAVEMRENLGQPTRGRVRLLEDPDENGRFQTSTVFCEDLIWPSALACYAGGVFVAASKEIVYLKDTDADGIADIRKVIMTGFGGTNALKSDSLLNNFSWGLDNRIHVATADMGGSVQTEAMGQPVWLNGVDFSFDPRSLIVIPENGPAGFARCFDSFGREYVSEPGHPLEQSIAERRYWARNPYYARAAPFQDVLSPATPLFFTRPGEAAPLAQGVASSTNATSAHWLRTAHGTAIYKGSLFPTNYWENAFICDPESHLVHRVVLQEKGLEVTGFRPGNEKNKEFLASSETSFNPVQAQNGPDGALYIVDARDGENGRIYRIVPESFKRPKPVQLAAFRTVDLVAALAHPNGWYRDTARRLLFEKRDPAALPLLSNLVSHSQLPLIKIHGLHALAGTGLLKDAQVLKALQDNDARVRLHALLVAEALSVNGTVADPVWNRMKAMTTDSSVRVRHQLALTAGTQRRQDKLMLLVQLLMRDPNNPWMQSAVLSSLGEGAGNMFLVLASDRRFRSDPGGLNFLQRLASMIGVKGRTDEVGQLVGFLGREKLEAGQAFPLLYALGDGLHRTRSALALVDPQAVLQGWYSTALLAAVDLTTPELLRIEGAKLVGVSPYTYAETSDWLLLVANPQPLPALRSAALDTLTRFDDPRLVPALLERWSSLTPQLRRQAVEGLLTRENRVPVVMNAIERGAIPVTDLQSPTMNFLRTYPDQSVSERAMKAFGPPATRRGGVLAQYSPALRLTGVAARGRELFIFRCAECHSMRDQGVRSMGPDLAGAKVMGKVGLLKAILEPDLEVSAPYRTWLIESQEGEIFSGVKVDEGPASVTLLQKRGNSVVWSRPGVRALYERTWSLMPEGLEQGLSAQNMADLLEYLINPF